MTSEVYAVYLTAATSTHPVGYVVNNVVCDSAATPTVSAGQAVVTDPDRKYPIGSTYPGTTS